MDIMTSHDYDRAIPKPPYQGLIQEIIVTLIFFLNDRYSHSQPCHLPLALAKYRADYYARQSEYTVKVECDGGVLHVAKAGRA